MFFVCVNSCKMVPYEPRLFVATSVRNQQRHDPMYQIHWHYAYMEQCLHDESRLHLQSPNDQNRVEVDWMMSRCSRHYIREDHRGNSLVDYRNTTD
jgi:hypothetical protein